MPIRVALLIGVLLVSGLALAIFSNKTPDHETGELRTVSNVNQSENANRVATNLNSSPPSPTPHPVSIPALMEMQLDGRDLILGAVQADNASYARHFVAYKSGDLTISGIMNIPKGNGPFPILILNHGYIDPAIYTNGRGLKREQDYLARQGFIVLHPDYRCHAQSDCAGQDQFEQRLGYVKDVMNAVQAVKVLDDPRFDKTRIGMLAHSMGGGVALNVMVAKPDLVQAIVLFAPVSGDMRDNYERWTKTRPSDAQQIIENYGSAEVNPTFWNNLSPLQFLSRVQAPVLNHHGTADESVPIEWSERLNRALLDAGKQVTYYTYAGQPHEFTSAWGMVMQHTTDFFKTSLK